MLFRSENMLKEVVKEYRLNIDSIDRNIELYPDPFNYVIQLGPITNSGINSSISRTNLKTDLKVELKNQLKNKKNIIVPQVYKHFTDAFHDIIIMDYLDGPVAKNVPLYQLQNHLETIRTLCFEFLFKYNILHFVKPIFIGVHKCLTVTLGGDKPF